ncbi:type I polyketide synthase [Actinoplanes sp. TFC3]|uniref:type I polyketide synthase n=1 Tax=Actinoplanes sp. TFC3 TaxID=1710355 RepID=UPI000B01ABDF|nr:type I polyketide synthase [Actinoplanes sp. TFC3]
MSGPCSPPPDGEGNDIAIVGMACRYPEAVTPRALWENALTGRRAFRRIPPERLSLDDYWSPDTAEMDRMYTRHAALIDGYSFDRVAFSIAGSTYRSTDPAHWLALDIASQALADAGFPDGAGLPRQRTSVVVGNTLTGDTSRANVMRLRWPYVRRVVGGALRELWPDDQVGAFLASLEERYKAPFAPLDEDTLPGSLSNTIAGRICNHFDLGGGGYTVDGACSSSLLSVITACRDLAGGDVDVAVAGGVDLSIDPFELIGFARAGALAHGEMRVYDRAANGFWPGEGCGMVVLMRHRDALAAGRRVYAAIAGWGISSDGRGGMTRPEAHGYRRALGRAYQRAGFGIETVPVFEGHGTGTSVGDDTELRALARARRAGGADPVPAAVSSVKAQIGHTKAAAGVAGLIKATLAVHDRLVPPAIGVRDPHPQTSADTAVLRLPHTAEPWPSDAELRAGVTAMGFGGINTHVVVTGVGVATATTGRFPGLARAVQDHELLMVDADSQRGLRERMVQLRELALKLSYSQLTDLAAALRSELSERPYRLAVVASSPDEFEHRLGQAADALDAGVLDDENLDRLTVAGGVFLHRAGTAPRIGLLFPGQGSGRGGVHGALRRRFAAAEQVWQAAPAAATAGVATEHAQPRIVTSSVAGLRVLEDLGIRAGVATGHSLGELTALHWAGAMDMATLLALATERGAAMSRCPEAGAMAGVAAPPGAVEVLIGAEPVVVAGLNGPRQTVVSGPADAVRRVGEIATRRGVGWTPLPVSHAFHSPLMFSAAEDFGDALARVRWQPVGRNVISTVSGAPLRRGTDLSRLLLQQLTAPVRFVDALAATASRADLLIEVGPGRVLHGLATEQSSVPVFSMDTDDDSLAGLLSVAGAAWTAGAPVRHQALFDGRPVHPFEAEASLTFLTSPCETVPELPVSAMAAPVGEPAPGERLATEAGGRGQAPVDVLRRLVAERAELPIDLIREETRLLDELHLSSIAVGQLVNQAATELGLTTMSAPTTFATATIGQLADALGELSQAGEPGPHGGFVPGYADWVRPFVVDWVPQPRPQPMTEPAAGSWSMHALPGHPFATALADHLRGAHLGAGVLLCLPPDCTESDLPMALAALREALAQPSGSRLVVVQSGRGVGALVRSARLEAPHLLTTLVDCVPGESGDVVADLVAEVAITTGYHEVRLGPDQERRIPVLRRMPVGPPTSQGQLGPGDVLLVSGGGKGITAECALALAADTGARVAIFGRSAVGEDNELAENLARLRAAGATVTYVRADVSDPEAVVAGVQAVEAEFGPVTAVLHGAGWNEPAPLPLIDDAMVGRALAPKLHGLQRVLAAVDPRRLRLLVSFGSIIGRAGLHGEAHYALANDWLAELTAEFGRRHPRCRAVCLEWSVWSGVGMGERLSVVEQLSRAGITPITPDDGVRVLREVLAVRTPPAVVVTGRTDNLETLHRERVQLPVLRFLERPLVHYPGIELIAESDLSEATDPYLGDHVVDGDMLFPAVLGLEAMAQAAVAVSGLSSVPVIEDAVFARALVVPRGRTVVIRTVALMTGDRVEVELRSSESGYGAAHFRAAFRFGPAEPFDEEPSSGLAKLAPVRLDPSRDMYGDVLFQSGRFRRLRSYRRVTARAAEAEVATMEDAGWFSPFLPAELILGDPGARDAFLHGLQVCVPDAVLLPVSVQRIETAGGKLNAATALELSATEREYDGQTYCYDVTVRTPEGTVVERMTGLRLRAVRRRDSRMPWAPALLGPHLQRQLPGRRANDVTVVVEPHEPGPATGRRDITSIAVARAAGVSTVVRHRSDGRPEVDGGGGVSAAHETTLSMAVTGPQPVACDVQFVQTRTEQEWRALLTGNFAVAEAARAGDENPGVARTRVWCAVECLIKAGRPPGAPLVLAPERSAGPRVVLRSGDLVVTTYAARLRPAGDPVVLAVLSGEESS